MRAAAPAAAPMSLDSGGPAAVLATGSGRGTPPPRCSRWSRPRVGTRRLRRSPRSGFGSAARGTSVARQAPGERLSPCARGERCPSGVAAPRVGGGSRRSARGRVRGLWRGRWERDVRGTRGFGGDGPVSDRRAALRDLSGRHRAQERTRGRGRSACIDGGSEGRKACEEGSTVSGCGARARGRGGWRRSPPGWTVPVVTWSTAQYRKASHVGAWRAVPSRGRRRPDTGRAARRFVGEGCGAESRNALLDRTGQRSGEGAEGDGPRRRPSCAPGCGLSPPTGKRCAGRAEAVLRPRRAVAPAVGDGRGRGADGCTGPRGLLATNGPGVKPGLAAGARCADAVAAPGSFGRGGSRG